MQNKIAIGNRQVGSRFSKNRPTCSNFEFFFLDPQLHQTFKPIRQLLCTFSYYSVLSINMIYNIYKFHKNQRPKMSSFISFIHNQLGRRSAAKIKRGSYLPGWCPPASPSSIKRGLGTERARLGTFRGFGTERARLGTFRGFYTERARLGAFRGFGTERARLGPFRGFLIFFFF